MAKADAWTSPSLARLLTGERPASTPSENTAVPAPGISENTVESLDIVHLDDNKREELSKMGPLKLQSEWTFWKDGFVKDLPPEKYGENFDKTSTIDTVQKFWSVYNNIYGPDKLGYRANLHFMRENIKPIWEDPANENGGSFNFKIAKKDSSRAWRSLLVLLIGEKLEDCLNDTICGLSVSPRGDKDNYQIWMKNNHETSDDEEVKERLATEVKEKLIKLLSDKDTPVEIETLYFKCHMAHNDFQKPAEGKIGSEPPPFLRRSEMPNDTQPPLEVRAGNEQKISEVVANIERIKKEWPMLKDKRNEWRSK